MSSKTSLVATGGWAFLVSAAVGRLPAAMIQLGLLMYVSEVGLGLSLGGLTVAAVGLGTALGATVLGRLVDAFGPLPVVLGATLVQTGMLYAIHLCTPGLVAGQLSSGVLLALAGVCGFANPQIGPIVRARWSHLSRSLDDPRLISDALGYEGAMDELSFIVGPIAASILVAVLGPTDALFVLLGCTLVGQGIFIGYLIGLGRAWGAGAHRGAPSGRMPLRKVMVPMVLLVTVGVCFGSTQTALTAVNDQRGTPGLTGVIYGCVGAGSAAASLLAPRLPRRWSLRGKLMFGAATVVLVALGFVSLPPTPVAVALALAIGGAVGIILVNGFARAESVAPSGRIASAMTLLSMCLTLGVSAGAATAGQLVADPRLGFVPVILAGAVGMVAASRLPRQEQPGAGQPG